MSRSRPQQQKFLLPQADRTLRLVQFRQKVLIVRTALFLFGSQHFFGWQGKGFRCKGRRLSYFFMERISHQAVQLRPRALELTLGVYFLLLCR